MARSNLQRRDALNIASKLGAEVERGGNHQRAVFRHNGRLVLTFGIRHGPTSGHGHLVGETGDLRLNGRKAKQLAECTMSKDEYVEHLTGMGLIEPVAENNA